MGPELDFDPLLADELPAVLLDESDELLELEDEFESLPLLLFVLEFVPDADLSVSLALTFFFLPDLKSVSYQPPPLRRKPAADIFLRKASCSQEGQLRSGSSLTFWITSKS